MEATILIPTYRHAALLPFSIESALAQDVPCDVVVVGDGVEDDTRAVVGRYPVRFFDFPKGERHGELHRHTALAEASGIVCYLGDDDLFYPDHVSHMLYLLSGADFAHSYPVFVRPDGIEAGMIDIGLPRYREATLRGDWNMISLTGAAHTVAAYRRLPYGWRPAPPDVWSDLWMWMQFLRQAGLKAVTGTRCTHLKLAASERVAMSVDQRVTELRDLRDRAANLRPEINHLAATNRRLARRSAVRF